MAEKIWAGADGNWNLGSNWSPVATVPVDADSVHFTGLSQQSVTSGLTLAAAGDVLAELNVHEDYTGSIGSSGSKLIVDACTVVRFNARGGKLFIDTDGGGITDIIVATAQGVSDMLEIDGTITNLQIVGAVGGVTITAGAALTNVDMHGSPNCVLTIGTGVTAMALVRMSSGLLDNSSTIAAGTGVLTMTGGRCIHRVGVIDELNLYAPAIFDDRSAEDITVLNGFGKATYDFRKSTATAKTIGTPIGYDGFRFLTRNAMNSLTLTNPYTSFLAPTDFEVGGGVAIG